MILKGKRVDVINGNHTIKDCEVADVTEKAIKLFKRREPNLALSQTFSTWFPKSWLRINNKTNKLEIRCKL